MLIHVWLRAYPQLDLSEAAFTSSRDYASFEAFFTRELAPGTRPMPHDPATLAAPVDGTLGACGHIDSQTLVQAKGQHYDLDDLLAGAVDAQPFIGGSYATFYLAPADYHRVHMPTDARLMAAGYVPGRLFGVGPRFVRTVPRLFTRNERVVLSFATDTGAIAVIFIGAFVVGGIHTRWHGRICPPHRWHSRALTASSPIETAPDTRIARGDYLGHFSIGSSVIVLTEGECTALADDLCPGQPCRVGQPIGRLQ